MNIKIENYNNIKSLNYELDENKINFLFGISGSGKSSIATALVEKDNESHITVGKTLSDLKVSVDGLEVDHTFFKIFNLNYMQDILIKKTNGTDIYTILFGDGGRIATCRTNYEAAISDLLNIKAEIVMAISNIGILIKELKLHTISKGDKFGSKSLNVVMEKNALAVPNYKNAITYNSSQIKWMADGTMMPSYKKNICPFCSKKITPARKNKIDKLIIFDSKTYEKIQSQSSIFSSFGLTIPDWKKKSEIKKFNQKLLDYISIKSELEKFNSYIDVASSMEIENIQITLEKPSKKLIELFPNIANAVDIFNQKIKIVKQGLISLKMETQNLIKKNSLVINQKLEVLGIPYRFVKQVIDEKNKSALYCICHILDNHQDRDRTNNLSFGEKNLIGLLLFLLANENAKGLIIDDPASSFDDYRRKVLFDMIYEFHKSSTVLVLSHDPTFAKFAAFHQSDSKKLIGNHSSISELKRKFYYDTGRIDYIESYSDSIIKKIELEDFGSLSDFVLERLNMLDKEINYQTAINLRMLFELKKKRFPLVYGYLSAIIHKCDYSIIQDEIVKNGKTENDILNLIAKESGIYYKGLSKNYLENINTFKYLDFEKLVKCRELINSRSSKNKVIKDELSNIIHLNDAQVYCLNPYKYNYFSKFVKDYIDKDLA